MLRIRYAAVGNKHYWNRANFEGLVSLSSALRNDPRLELLARYCDLRERGLRRQAFAELESFLKQAQTWTTPVRRAIAVRILDAHWKTPQAHQFLAEPLRSRFLERVLEEWRAAEPDNPIPLRHLALLRSDDELLRSALRMNPNDDVVRARLAGILLSLVDYATHHLVEGMFIGDEADASATLAEAAAVLKDAADPGQLQSLNEEVESLTALVADWRQYRTAPEGTFPEWCRARNRVHPWCCIVYYERRDV